MDKQDFDKRYRNLTSRPQEVAQKLVNGETDKDIALELDIEPVTVRIHISKTCQKFGFKNKPGERLSFRDDLIDLLKQYKPEIFNQESASQKDKYKKFPSNPNSFSKTDIKVTLIPSDPVESQAETFSIHRGLKSYQNWFDEFEDGLHSDHLPGLNSEMAYYGPCLAKSWFNLSIESEGERQRRLKFEQCIKPLLHKYVKEDVDIIDLGIGNFEMGRIILDEIINSKLTNSLNYYGYDISYEMLIQAFDIQEVTEKSRLLRKLINDNSIVAGINDSFENLYIYKHLFKAKSSCFLLLGNTLGNEPDEVYTLELIRRAMRESDILIAEVQLIEEQPLQVEDLTEGIQQEWSRNFYAGPFIVLGCEQFKMAVRVSDANRFSQLYTIACHFSEPTTIKHLGFSRGEVRVREGDVPVYLVRKYKNEEAVQSIFEKAGFKVIRTASTPTTYPQDRKFHYVVAEPRKM